jgi:hypothetical protein
MVMAYSKAVEHSRAWDEKKIKTLEELEPTGK